jgi:hypothetical protein
MKTLRTARALAMIVLLIAPASVVTATPSKVAPKVSGGGVSFPINVTSTDQGTFTGSLLIRRFAAQRGQIVALGTVTGTLTDENGVSVGVLRNVVLPVTIRRVSSVSTEKQSGASSEQVSMRKVSLQEGCQVLHLEIGPVNLNLAGLAVNLSGVAFDIAGEPGPVGDLVCAILDLLGNVAAVVNLLNALLGLLTGLVGGIVGGLGGVG